MKIPNTHNKSIQEIVAQLSDKYPGAVIRKPFLTPTTIIAPKGNFKFLVRDKRSFFRVDFTPPVVWVIGAILLSMVFVSGILSLIYGQFVFGFGGALWIILALLVVKSIFKSRNRSQFETFYTDLREAVNSDKQSSIF